MSTDEPEPDVVLWHSDEDSIDVQLAALPAVAKDGSNLNGSCSKGCCAPTSAKTASACQIGCCDDSKVKSKQGGCQDGCCEPKLVKTCKDGCCDEPKAACPKPKASSAACKDGCCDAPKSKAASTCKDGCCEQPKPATKSACKDACCDDKPKPQSACKDACCDDGAVMVPIASCQQGACTTCDGSCGCWSAL